MLTLHIMVQARPLPPVCPIGFLSIATPAWPAPILIGLVLSAVCCAIYLCIQNIRLRRRIENAEKLFFVIGDSGSDLIAVVDTKGRRLYNSPSYQRLLGYSQEYLKNTFGLDQIHPDDRQQVLAAAQEVRQTGKGSRLEYRMPHRDGFWRI